MSLNNKIKQQGFTIVELLIVIVVIGILAAITIVAYNGVQNRAKTTALQSAAINVSKKAELYNTELSAYPGGPTQLTSGAAGKTYELVGATFDSAAFTTSNLPATTSELTFYRCGTGTAGAAGTLAAVTNITGVRIDYWSYTASSVASVSAGVTSGTSPYTINCYITNAGA